ncbi:Methyltransferase type [Rhodopirellula maiorica SM1]|uniref:Methyltransferase type n=1 Tax=Rhodopirellula maiorica SM1 TaxID=1265738 RepID=M5RS63_9BACT|nr:methyltransferase domain-containing protein [Rhodopirellula maiorica]EMI22188.1 Methyltransferase type [Rhodopirellula maiorica SM1]
MSFDRVREPVWIDDPAIDAAEFQRVRMDELRLNQVTRVADALYPLITRYQSNTSRRPLTVLDVSSGNGDLAVRWAVKAARDRRDLRITTVDTNRHAIEEQQRLAKRSSVEVQSIQLNSFQSPLPLGFDVVISTMLMHRLDESQAFRLLQSMQVSCQQAMIVCDFKRSRLNCALVNVASRLLVRSAVCRHDAVARIQSSFSEREIARIARSALGRPVTIRPLLPCHFVLVADEAVQTEMVPAFA